MKQWEGRYPRAKAAQARERDRRGSGSGADHVASSMSKSKDWLKRERAPRDVIVAMQQKQRSQDTQGIMDR